MGEFIKIRDEKGRIVKGNPPGPGRPLGDISIVSALKRKLLELGPDQKRTYLEHFTENTLQDALDTDGPSRKLVMQYIEGLPQQKLELTHIVPRPLDDVSENNSIQEDKAIEEAHQSDTGWDSSV